MFIGRGPADAELFQPFYQARFGEAWRWLGEVLLGLDLSGLEPIILGDGRQDPIAVLVFGVVAALLIEPQVSVEFDDRASGTQDNGTVGCPNIDRDLLERRQLHGTGDGPLPD